MSGLTSLAYQTLWTRLLASGTGNFTYVFTMILALFLIGIALGAIAFDAIRPRIRSTVGLLAVAQLATGSWPSRAGFSSSRARRPASWSWVPHPIRYSARSCGPARWSSCRRRS